MPTWIEVAVAVITALFAVLGIVWGFYRRVRGDLKQDRLDYQAEIQRLEKDLSTAKTDAEAREEKHREERRTLRQELDNLQETVDKLTRTNGEKDQRIAEQGARIAALETQGRKREETQVRREKAFVVLSGYVATLEAHVGQLNTLMQAGGIEVPPMPPKPSTAKQPRRRRAKADAS